MADRLRKTTDGTLVGLVSGIAVALLALLLVDTPIRSHLGLVLMGPVAGGLAGWVFKQSGKEYGLQFGALTGLIGVGLILAGTLPLYLAMAVVGVQATVPAAVEMVYWMLVWMLVSTLAGVLLQQVKRPVFRTVARVWKRAL